MMERAGKMRLQGTASRTTVQDVVEAKLAALCNITTIHGNEQSLTHRRRMEREAKANSLRRFGFKISSISCRASCFASVYLKEKVDFNS